MRKSIFGLLSIPSNLNRKPKRFFRNLTNVTDRFLKEISVEYLGHIYRDSIVPKSVRQQKAFMEVYPYSKVSQCVSMLSVKIADEERLEADDRDRTFFWKSAFQLP